MHLGLAWLSTSASSHAMQEFTHSDACGLHYQYFLTRAVPTRLDRDTGPTIAIGPQLVKSFTLFGDRILRKKALRTIHHVDGRAEPQYVSKSLTENSTLRARDVGLIPYFQEVDTSRNPLDARGGIGLRKLSSTLIYDVVTDFNLRCDWGQYDGCTNWDERTTVPRGLLLVKPT
jgi:hypothetical protein